MMIAFEKYQGAGNDFIMINGELCDFPFTDYDMIHRLCDRHFGIGADGLIVIDKEIAGLEQFNMLYYNSDGRPGSLCGNGGRCAALFAYRQGWVKEKMLFNAADGLHEAEILNEQLLSLRMKDVDEILNYQEDQILNTGSPHYIRWVDDVQSVAVKEEGKAIRNSPAFVKEGINVNFVSVAGEKHLHLRTFERGVEDETLACGTGTVAAVLAYAFKVGMEQADIRVKAQGGELSVRFEKEGNRYTNIWLSGPVRKVFQGSIQL